MRPERSPGSSEWLMLQPPVWVPWLWWTALLASVIASMAGNPPPSCSVGQPCEPDAVFPIVVALVCIAAAAFWWEPMTALVAGLGYAALGVLFDPSAAGRYAEGVVGLIALGCLSFLRALRAKQAQVADQASEFEALIAAPPLSSPSAKLRGLAVAYLLVGIAGILLAAGSVVGYHAATNAEQAHLDRAQASQARVVSGVDDDYRQAFQLEDGPRAGTRVLISVADELQAGTEHHVLLDPADPSWVRLSSEPRGYTFWFGWAAVGLFAAGWATLRLVAWARTGATRSTPRQHGIRLTSDERAELMLARGSRPVAVVPVAGAGHAPRGGHVPIWNVEPAIIRGPVAHGRWVSIDTRRGPLTVTGPVRATPRWRAQGIVSPAMTAHGSATASALGARVGRYAEQLRSVGHVVGQVLLVALGCLLLWLGIQQGGPTWDAAHGRGVPGSITITSVDCGGRGPCQHYGTFRSADGQYSFTDVELVGDSADVGTAIPAFYEGHGETPDSVFAPGWSGFAESGFFVIGAVLAAGGPIGRILAAASRHRRPPQGRHAAGHS